MHKNLAPKMQLAVGCHGHLCEVAEAADRDGAPWLLETSGDEGVAA